MQGKSVISDSTVLIFLGKLNRLDLLRAEYSQIFIPPKIFEEVVEEGKRLGEKDAILIEEAIEEGWIEVKEIDSDGKIEKFNLEDGETKVLSLAKDFGHKEVLADEESVREVARILGLDPRGTLYFLFGALKWEDIDFEDFLELLENLIDSGFYINESIYSKAVRRAKEISEE